MALVVRGKEAKKEKKTVDKMSQDVNTINERLKALSSKVSETNSKKKEGHQERLKAMRANPHYQAMAREYANHGSLDARVAGSTDPVNDKDYLADVVSAHVMHGTPLENLKTTAYVQALVDPEGCGANAGVPDCVPLDTYRYQSIVELPIGASFFDFTGRTNIVTCPDIVDHVLLPCDNALDEEYTFVNAHSTPYARQGDLFDYNLIDPAESVPVDTPDPRVHFSGNTDASGDSITIQIDARPVAFLGLTAAVAPLQAHPFLAVLGSGTLVSTTQNCVTKSLNPGRKKSYPFAQASDDLHNESTWQIDSAATVVDKFVFPSQFSEASDASPHIVYPMYINMGGGRYFVSGDIPIAHLRGTLVAQTQLSAVAESFIAPLITLSIHGYQLGNGGGDATGHEFELQYSIPLPLRSIKAASAQFPFDVPFDVRIGPDEFQFGVGIFRCHDLVDDVWNDGINSAFAIDSISVTACFVVAAEPVSTTLVYAVPVSSVVFDEIQFGYKIGPEGINTVITRNSPSGAGAWAWNPFQAGCFMGAYAVDQLPAFSSGLWTKYRPVSMSTWLTYVGGTLNDIGEVYGSFIADHRFVADRDHNYLSASGLSSIANAYRGKAPMGAYGIWKPLSEKDLDMRSLSSKWNFNRGYTSLVLDSGTDHAAQNFVLRVVANFEVITLAAVYRESLRQSTIDQNQLWGAFALLQHFPMVMANDEHQSAISSFFSGLWNGVKKAAGFVTKNIGGIAQVAKGIGSIL